LILYKNNDDIHIMNSNIDGKINLII
jgi:hypothetical protein